MRSRLLVAVAASLALAGAPAVVSAQTEMGQTSAQDGVLYPACLDHPYRVSLALPSDTQSWVLEVDLIAPDGSRATGNYLTGTDPTEIFTSYFYMCPEEPAGTFRILGEGTYTDIYNITHKFSTTESQFTLRRARSKVQLRASNTNPDLGQVVRLGVEVAQEFPGGFFPHLRASVELQRKVGSEWKRYPGTSLSTVQGEGQKLKLRWTSRKPQRVRVVVKAAASYAGSTSNVIRLR